MVQKGRLLSKNVGNYRGLSLTMQLTLHGVSQTPLPPLDDDDDQSAPSLHSYLSALVYSPCLNRLKRKSNNLSSFPLKAKQNNYY